MNCVSKFRKGAAWWKANTPTLEDIQGSENLEEEDCGKVEDLLESLRSLGTEGGSGAAAATSTSRAKRKAPTNKHNDESSGNEDEDNDDDGGDEDEDDEADADDESATDGTTSTATPVTASPPKKAKSAAPATVKAETSNARQQQQQQSQQYTAEALTVEQLGNIRAEIAKLKSYKNDDLKKILRQNEQILSGKKDELIERCAEGVVLGAIPKVNQRK